MERIFDPATDDRLVVRLRHGLRALSYDEDLSLVEVRKLQARNDFPECFPLNSLPGAPLVCEWSALQAIVERQKAMGRAAIEKRRARTRAATAASLKARCERRKTAAASPQAQAENDNAVPASVSGRG
jgi:hypothetical protein